MSIDILSRHGYHPLVIADQVWMDRVISLQVRDAASSIQVLSPQGVAVTIPLAGKTAVNLSGADRVFYAALGDDDELVYCASGIVNKPKLKAGRVAGKTIAKHAQEIVKGDFALDFVDLAKAGWVE